MLSRKVLTGLRLQSTGSGSAPFNKSFKSSFENFIRTAKLDKDGFFIKDQASTADFKVSNLNKFVEKSKVERDNLINEKLKELSIDNKIDLPELQDKFNKLVSQRELQSKIQSDKIYNSIVDFSKKLESNSFWDKLIDGLYPFGENLHKSPAFQLIKSIDEHFANALANIIQRVPNKASVKTLQSSFENGPISKISTDQYQEILKSLDQSIEVEEINELNSQLGDEVDGETVMSTIFASLNMYDDINKSPLFMFIKEIDPSFSKLLTEYSQIDPESEEALEKSIEEIVTYCSNKESLIYQSFTDSSSGNFEKVKEILEQPLPIDLTEIYEIFETFPDYFTSDLFKVIESMDPEFCSLLKSLETVPEGKELDEVNAKVDEYLSNPETPIYIAMNDVQSANFKQLRETIDLEWENFDNSVTTDKIIDYVSKNGVDSDGFKLIQKIDLNFSKILNDLVSETDNEKVMTVYNSIQDFLDQPNEISHVLGDKESLNYQLLSDIILPVEEEILEPIEEAAIAEIKEDQSNLPAEVKEINEMYDLASKVIDELKLELENNTFIQPSRSIESSLEKLLGFQPTKDQIDSSLNLKEKPLPKHTDEVLELCVNIIMKDGKKEIARKNLNRTLYLLFLETRENPIELLKKALDLVAPLVITKTVKTGFAKNFTVPSPLTQRQRDRMALKWILDSCDSKASNDFPVRLCEEIMFVLTGKSKLMDKRVLSHKMAISNRSYLKI